MKYRRPLAVPQGGFTLIELLIVITIISLLTAITVPIVGDLLNKARNSATKATILKVQELLNKRTAAFERDFPAWFKRTYSRAYNPNSVSDLLVRKKKFREMFPQFNVSNPTSDADSAEALYELITNGESFGSAADDVGNFTAGEVDDTDGDGKMEFVDGWEQPLRWYPWPTQLMKNAGARRQLTSNLPNDLTKDPDDPLGALTSLDPANFHDISTYHTPLIVSAGADGELGLYEPYDKANNGHLAMPNGDAAARDDNITNLNNKAGSN